MSDISVIEAVIRDVLYSLSDQEVQTNDGRLILPEDVPHTASAIYTELIRSGKIIEKNGLYLNTSFDTKVVQGNVNANVSILDVISAFLRRGKSRKNRDD